MNNKSKDHFFEELIKINIHSVTDESLGYEENISGFKRNILAVLCPQTTVEVQKIVSLANEHGMSLYPISCGGNWAFGSRLPVGEDNIVVDLKAMNQIFEVNLESGYAVIGPGVTQGQLEEHLEGLNSKFYVDVTGSGRNTSVIGNSIERGIAYNSLRADNILSHEVVLGNGDLLSDGYAQFSNSSTQHLYKYAFGPYINGLWGQSNFGIVTKATYKLFPKDKESCFFQLKFNEDSFEEVIDAIHELRRHKVIEGIIHMPDRGRSVSSIMPNLVEKVGEQAEINVEKFITSRFTHEWTAFGKISGPGMGDKRKIFKKAFRGKAKLNFFSLFHLNSLIKFYELTGNALAKAFFEISKEFASLSLGKSTDMALKLTNWFPKRLEEKESSLDSSSNGLLFCVPLFPFNGRDSKNVVNLVKKHGQGSSLIFAMTLNAITEEVIEAVISISFDKDDPAQVEQAHNCLRDMYEDLRVMGHYPYRLNVNNMTQFIDRKSSHWTTVAKIKKTLDPNNVIAPGRYV